MTVYRSTNDSPSLLAQAELEARPIFDEGLPMCLTTWRLKFRRLFFDEDGPTSVEYAVMLALIVAACIGAVQNMSQATGSSFDRSSQAITQALSG